LTIVLSQLTWEVLIAPAASVGASELITTAKPSRSIHRARAIKVVTIHPEG
jgi:hypothetical protein